MRRTIGDTFCTRKVVDPVLPSPLTLASSAMNHSFIRGIVNLADLTIPCQHMATLIIFSFEFLLELVESVRTKIKTRTI